MTQHRAAKWLRQVAPNGRVVARNNSVLEPIPELARIWRLLTTPELRPTPHVAAFFDFMVDEIDTLKPILTG